MKLLTQELLKKLPPLYGTEEIPYEDKKVVLKLFNPGGAQTFYIVEYSPEERMFFGMADLFGNKYDMELGYISQDEIENFKGRFDLKIERDLHWNSNTTVKDILSGKTT